MDVLVLVYFPTSLLIVQRLLSLILRLTKPVFVCISSTNESCAPRSVVSVLGLFILLARFLFVSKARYLLSSNNIIVKP